MELPEKVRADMNLHDYGVGDIPESYMTFHSKLVWKDIYMREWKDDFKVLEDHGLTTVPFSGGMQLRVISAAIKEEGEWNAYRLMWHESGAWFRLSKGGGWVRHLEIKKYAYDSVMRDYEND